MSLLSDAVGVPAKAVEALATLPVALISLQRSVDRLADICEGMSQEVSRMREGVDRLREEVAVLEPIRDGVGEMGREVATMSAGVQSLQPAVEGLTQDLARLPFLRRRSPAA